MPLVTYATQTPAPWANGGGTTVQLVTLTESAALTPDLPPWRLSIATLHQPAPFSPLPGLHRQFMPVGGSVVLVIDGKRMHVSDGTVCAFDGGATVDLVELSGACHAVNLMVATDPGAPTPTPTLTPALTLSRIAPGEPLPHNTLCALPLEAASGVNRFDLIRPTTVANYAAGRTGPWAAIAKSGCQSGASPSTAN